MRRRIVVMVMLTLALTLLAFSAPVLAEQAQQQQGEIVHIVQPGENLFRISLRYNVTIQAIQQRNGISNPNLIYAGQQLIIPVGGGTVPPPTTVTPPPGDGGVVNYTVVRGDSLSRIAARFGSTVQAIASANGITNPNLIYAGQVLRIPQGGGTVPPPVTPPPGGGNPPPTGAFELGGHVFGFQYPDQMRGAGMTWAKIQVSWNRGDPPSIVQGAIDSARSRGFKILLGIVGRPEQLAANPTQYYQEFANFLAGVAQLGPDAIEVWNEPNIDRQWPAGQINGRNYTQMLSAAYLAIKGANANVLVISGAPAPTGFFGGTCQANGCDDNVFIRDMAAAGAAQYMDCVGVHYNEGIVSPYARSGDPRGNSSHYTRYYGTMVDLYASTFPSTQLCFTELGYLTGEGIAEPLPAAFGWAASTTLANQAEWLAGAVTQARGGTRVRLMIIWNVDAVGYAGGDPQGGYAIIRPDNTCPSCNALRTAMGL